MQNVAVFALFKRAMLEKVTLFFVLLAMPCVSLAQETLEVEVTAIEDAKGSIIIALFDKKDDFLKKPLKSQKIEASATNVLIYFKELPPGDYAISLIHDENDNGELDKNILGIPREGFGFGNNAMGRMGPPSFADASVTLVVGGTHTVIRVRYFL